MVKPNELLSQGFEFINDSQEAMIYYIDNSPKKVITYLDGTFELGLNGCCWTQLNIDNINDLILTIDLLSTDGNTLC
jgi:hypothetical protein